MDPRFVGMVRRRRLIQGRQRSLHGDGWDVRWGVVGPDRRSRSHLMNDPMIITVMKVPTLEMRAAIQWIHWKGLLKVRVSCSLRASCCCRARISICWRTSGWIPKRRELRSSKTGKHKVEWPDVERDHRNLKKTTSNDQSSKMMVEIRDTYGQNFSTIGMHIMSNKLGRYLFCNIMTHYRNRELHHIK